MMLLVGFAVTQTLNFSVGLYDYALFPLTNSKLDSLQEKKINALEDKSINFYDKRDFNKDHNGVIEQIENISKNQKEFQKNIMSKYDKRFDMMNKSLHEIKGVIKGSLYIDISMYRDVKKDSIWQRN